MSLVNYVVIELTLNILFFHKMKLQKIKQLLFMAQKLEKCGKKSGLCARSDGWGYNRP